MPDDGWLRVERRLYFEVVVLPRDASRSIRLGNMLSGRICSAQACICFRKFTVSRNASLAEQHARRPPSLARSESKGSEVGCECHPRLTIQS